MLQNVETMNADNEGMSEADIKPVVVEDDTGSLLLTAVSCDDPPLVPRLKASVSNKTARKTPKKAVDNPQMSSIKKRKVSADSSVKQKKVYS